MPFQLCSHTFAQASLPVLAEAAGAAGFAYITTIPRQFVANGGRSGDLRKRIEDEGVRVNVLDGLCSVLPGTPAPQIRDGSFTDPHEASFEDCVEIAHALGADTINLVHIRGEPTPVAKLAEAFAVVCERARGEGLAISIEFVPGTGVPDVATAVAIASRRSGRHTTLRSCSTLGTGRVTAACLGTSIPRRPR